MTAQLIEIKEQPGRHLRPVQPRQAHRQQEAEEDNPDPRRAEQEGPCQEDADDGTTTDHEVSLDPSHNPPGYISELIPRRPTTKQKE